MNRAALVMFLCSLAAVASAAGDSRVHLEDRTDGSGVRKVVMPDRAIVERTPEWQPESGWPLLKLDAAVAAAVASLKSVHTKIDDFELTQATVHRVGDSSLPNRWYLFLDFDPRIDGSRLFGGSYWAVVLLDGTVLLPEPAPRDGDR